MGVKILSIHWGYSIGGVGKYASIIDRVGEYEDIEMQSICLVSRKRQVDKQTMESLSNITIVWRDSPFDFSWYEKLKNLIMESKPDLLMSHGFNGHFIAWLARRFIGREQKVICSYHGLYHATTMLRYIPGYLYNRFTEYYIRNIVVSAVAVAGHCKQYLQTKNVASDKVCAIHNGLRDYVSPSEKRNEYRSLFGIADEDVLLGVASRLDPVKGIEFLVDAFSKCSHKHDNLKLLIIGTGTVERSLKALCSDRGVADKVIFTGFRDDVPDCLAALDIFVLPSLAEYHSIGLLEAMRAEKAIISTDVGGNTESVRHDQEGLIVSSKSAGQLEDAIDVMLDDRVKAEGLAIAARKRFLENFTEEVMIKKTAAWMIDSSKGKQ